jgi:hypothetical protein
MGSCGGGGGSMPEKGGTMFGTLCDELLLRIVYYIGIENLCRWKLYAVNRRFHRAIWGGRIESACRTWKYTQFMEGHLFTYCTPWFVHDHQKSTTVQINSVKYNIVQGDHIQNGIQHPFLQHLWFLHSKHYLYMVDTTTATKQVLRIDMKEIRVYKNSKIMFTMHKHVYIL